MRRRPSGTVLLLVGTGLLAVAGILVHVVARADWSWWVGIAMVLPVVAVVVFRTRGGSGDVGGDGGAWGPP